MSRLRNLVRKKAHEPMRVRTFHSSKVVLIDENYRLDYEKEIRMLPEFQARQKLSEFLLSRPTTIHQEIKPKQYEYKMSEKQVCMALDAAMATFHLHVESRIASLCGKGFYTIGPCGEELLSSAGLVFDKKDTVALHYRHLGISLARQLACNNHHLSTQTINNSMLSGLLLDRARGHTVSLNDPVCGGVHCALGSNPNSSTYENDYVVTSTLASQCSPAVGRALGFALTNNTKRVSFVTIGDGSIHNAHFLSSLNLAQHATYRNLKCPVIFGISDNGLSISYKTHQYTQHFLSSSFLNKNIPVYTADATDMWDVYDKTMQANKYSKTYSAPSILHYTNITRQFGHAATDRQSAYLTHEEISYMAQSNVLTQAILQAVSKDNDYNITYDYLQKRFEQIQQQTINAFNIAVQEPKITSRSSMIERLSPPLVPVPALPSHLQKECTYLQEQQSQSTKTKKNVDVMRKHMTRIITETMEQDENVVYIGEDVRHGGYYLVTDQISNKVENHRIIDFPPDETTLLGAGLGLSQVGLTPIVEIPYSKYLDCGADMYYEIALLHWLTSKKNGMVIRLQGFDKGVFGGNFHTHNMISHIPPGVDVVCYSNGRDYVRGFRNAILQVNYTHKQHLFVHFFCVILILNIVGVAVERRGMVEL